MGEDIEVKAFDKLVAMITDIKSGLDPDVLANWYAVVVSEAKRACPAELAATIEVKQDPILPMKFQLKASKRAVPYIFEAIEDCINHMPFATRLYFQKLEEIIVEEAAKPAA